MNCTPLLRLFCALFLLLSALSVQAQISPAATRFSSVYGYAEASGAEHELNYGHALGGSGGIILQHSPWFALDLRGVVLTARVPLHTFVGEAGPRVSYRFGPVHPYAEALGGLGHSGYTVSPRPLLAGFGAAWTVDFGTDLRVTPRLDWRVAEYSRSHIYAGSGASPSILSTGFVFRIF